VLDERVGNLAPGLDGDAVVLDLEATPLIDARTARVEDVSELLAVLMTLGDDRCVQATYAAGAQVWERPDACDKAQ